MALLVGAGLLQGCSGAAPSEDNQQPPVTVPAVTPLAAGTVHTGVACAGNAAVTYTLYVPAQPAAVLLLMDAHSRARLVAERMQLAADSLGLVLAVSETSRNGMPLPEQTSIADALISDLGKRGYMGQGPLLLGGFSGGARAASAVAAQHLEVQGLLCIGAGVAQGVNARTLGCDLLLVAGCDDFNYWELADLETSLQGRQARHAFAQRDGGHEWPSETEMVELLAWLLRKPDVPTHVQLVADFAPMQRWRQEEMGMRDQLGGELGKKPIAEWKPLLASLWKRATEDKTAEVRHLHHRVLSYLSLMCYLQADGALKQGNGPAAAYWTELYALVDPENAESAVLLAVQRAREQRAGEALGCLRQAAALGFADAARLEQHSDLGAVRAEAGWAEVLASVKANVLKL